MLLRKEKFKVEILGAAPRITLNHRQRRAHGDHKQLFSWLADPLDPLILHKHPEMA